jgi:DNA-binding protein HU-beta
MAKKARKSKSKAKKSKAKSKTKKKVAKKAKKAAKRKKGRRTVLYSSKGKKLYAVRDKGGKFKDIQSYQRAHSMDMKRESKDEAAVSANGSAPAASEAPKPM